MRRSTAAVLVSSAVIALAAFYVAWPVWTGYRIREAIETGNAALLEDKVDFPSVRVTMRPVLKSELERSLTAGQDRGGLGGLIASQLKGDRVDRLLDAAIATVVTPEAVIRTVREGRSVRELSERILKGRTTGEQGEATQRGGIGGVLGQIAGRSQTGDARGSQPPAQEPSKQSASPPAKQAEPGAKRRLTLANIKSFAIEGPLAFSFGVARDVEKAEPDVVVKLAFTSFDWRVVGVLPQINR